VPLTHAEILGRLANGFSPSFVGQLVKTRGIAFPISDSFLTQVKLAGGSGILIERLSILDRSSLAPLSTRDDESVEHLAKCAELIHIGDLESAEPECRASIEENPKSPWPLLVSANLPVYVGPKDDGVTSRAAEQEKLRARAAALDPQRLTSSQFEGGGVNPNEFLSNDTSEQPQPNSQPPSTQVRGGGVLGQVPIDLDLASSHRNLAYVYFRAKEFENAQRELETAIRLEPDNPGNHTYLANFLHSARNDESALQELREAARIVPFGAAQRNLLANALEQLGRTTEAIKQLNNLLAIKPRDTVISTDLVELYLKHNDRKSAIAELRRSLKATSLSYSDESEFVEARLWDFDRLATLLRDERQFADATEQYLYVLRFQPNNPNMHNNYGNVLMEQNRLDQALAEFDLALRFDPEMPYAHNNIGVCLSRKKDFDGAIREFRQALELNDYEAFTHVSLGMALGHKGDLKAAKEQFQQYIEQNPKTAHAHANVGYALYQLKDTPAAVEELRAALQLDPDFPAAQNNLAWIFATADDPKLRNPAEALVLARKAVKGSPTPNPAFLDTLAEALLLNGQPAEALKIEKQVAVLDPNNPDIPARLAHFQAAFSQATSSIQ
jgi:tetratricopeptide (TPR) repeat protein